jgi:hypothetical protein
MSKIKTLTDKQYLNSKGTKCPNCHSTDIDGQEVDIDGDVATQEIGCNECNASWIDTYVRTGYTNLVVPKESTEENEED